MLKKHKTNKLFYGCYPYKITCKVDGISFARTPKSLSFHLQWNFTRKVVNYEILNAFLAEAQEFINNKDIKKRIEHNYIDFYLRNEQEYTNVQQTLQKYVDSVTIPESKEQLATLLENKKYILCDKLPHNKYHYKVTFKDMPFKVRNDLIAWAEKYNNDDIYITKSTRSHFKALKNHYGSHYFYVKDSKIITLIAMAASGYIRRTDEYVVRNSINTESNQELLCQP